MKGVQDVDGVFAVEIPRGLVGEDDPGVCYQCTSDGDTLSLTATDLAGSVVGTMTDPQLVKQLASSGS